MEESALLPYITDISIFELLLSEIFSKKLSIVKIRKHNNNNIYLRGLNNKDIWYIYLDAEPKKLIFRGSTSPKNKFSHEKEIYNILSSNTNLPVPNVYHIESCNSLSWMIMDYMPGVSYKWFLDRKNSMMNEVWAEFGKAIAQIVSCKKTGGLDIDSTKKSEKILDYLQEHYGEREAGKVGNEKKSLLNIIDNYTPRLSCIDIDILLKMDKGKWKVSGIIDVEHMNYGDARYAVMLYHKLGGDPFTSSLFDNLDDNLDNYELFVKAQRELSLHL